MGPIDLPKNVKYDKGYNRVNEMLKRMEDVSPLILAYVSKNTEIL